MFYQLVLFKLCVMEDTTDIHIMILVWVDLTKIHWNAKKQNFLNQLSQKAFNQFEWHIVFY